MADHYDRSAVAKRIRRAFKQEEERAKAYWAEFRKGKAPHEISVPPPGFYVGRLERELEEEGVITPPDRARDV